ncbi:hypothetical protein [Paraburkholderia sp. UCT2]|uniref:hypothetical protein n=1 Tax=Paraburkholderia sp. UCT2 TaxID=2615208 RepID=UPI0016565A37|nr:hypothetical protein [Paraburkholderia sp. UCT2]MBC8729992.1 hypothetical protein [Paraburkholderia sp. UCT2]
MSSLQNDPSLLDLSSAGVRTFSFTPDQLQVSADVAFIEVNITPGVQYRRGDLLAFDAGTNTVTPAETADEAANLCPFNMTPDQADAQVAAQYAMQVFAQGEFNELLVTLNGEPLSAADLAAVKGKLNAGGNIRLRSMA